MRNKPNNIENQNESIEESSNIFENEKNLEKHEEIQNEITQQKNEQNKEAKYLAWLLENENIGEILSKYLKLDQESIEYIENLNEPKDMFKVLQFLNNTNYINKTNEKYLKLFKEVKEEFKRANILKIIKKLTNAVNKKNLKQIISIKKDFDNMNIKDFKKMAKKLKKYEKGEFIDLPNGLSYEICTIEEEKKNKKKIPNDIKLGDDEYFIKTHVDRGADYRQYVSSLLEMSKLFKNKGINLKYVKRSTWLVNKEFLKAYEQEFLKPKYGDRYEKIQSMKVLEDTASAEIFYQIKEGTNPYDEKDKKKNPLRFIKDKNDLLGYITQDDKHLKSFNEAEMWLDLDKLESHPGEQCEDNNQNKKNINEETNDIQKISPEVDDTVRKSYVDSFLSIIGNNKKLSKIVESLKNGSKMELSIKDIENIYSELNNIYQKSRKDFIEKQLMKGSKEGTAHDKFKALSKFCMDPEAIKTYKTFNCSGVSFMMASIIESLGGTAYMVSIYHHYICMAEIQGRQYAIDTNMKRHEDITDKIKIEDTEYDYIKKFNSKKPLFKEYTEGYVFGSLQEAEKIINGSNYQTMDKEEYKEVCDKIKGLLTEEKINSYPKDYPKHDDFPEFDRQIYDIHKKQNNESGIIGKMKLKVQEWLIRLKRWFSKKK